MRSNTRRRESSIKIHLAFFALLTLLAFLLLNTFHRLTLFLAVGYCRRGVARLWCTLGRSSGRLKRLGVGIQGHLGRLVVVLIERPSPLLFCLLVPVQCCESALPR